MDKMWQSIASGSVDSSLKYRQIFTNLHIGTLTHRHIDTLTHRHIDTLTQHDIVLTSVCCADDGTNMGNDAVD